MDTLQMTESLLGCLDEHQFTNACIYMLFYISSLMGNTGTPMGSTRTPMGSTGAPFQGIPGHSQGCLIGQQLELRTPLKKFQELPIFNRVVSCSYLKNCSPFHHF